MAMVAGDFNQDPKDIAEWLSIHQMPFVVFAQKQPTYVASKGKSNIDYMVMSPEIAAMMADPELLPLSGLAGHRPFQATWRGGNLDRMVNVWDRPERRDATPVFGPIPAFTAVDEECERIHLQRTVLPEPGTSYRPAEWRHLYQPALLLAMEWQQVITPVLAALGRHTGAATLL